MYPKRAVSNIPKLSPTTTTTTANYSASCSSSRIKVLNSHTMAEDDGNPSQSLVDEILDHSFSEASSESGDEQIDPAILDAPSRSDGQPVITATNNTNASALPSQAEAPSTSMGRTTANASAQNNNKPSTSHVSHMPDTPAIAPPSRASPGVIGTASQSGLNRSSAAKNKKGKERVAKQRAPKTSHKSSKTNIDITGPFPSAGDMANGNETSNLGNAGKTGSVVEQLQRAIDDEAPSCPKCGVGRIRIQGHEHQPGTSSSTPTSRLYTFHAPKPSIVDQDPSAVLARMGEDTRSEERKEMAASVWDATQGPCIGTTSELGELTRIMCAREEPRAEAAMAVLKHRLRRFYERQRVRDIIDAAPEDLRAQAQAWGASEAPEAADKYAEVVGWILQEHQQKQLADMNWRIKRYEVLLKAVETYFAEVSKEDGKMHPDELTFFRQPINQRLLRENEELLNEIAEREKIESEVELRVACNAVTALMASIFEMDEHWKNEQKRVAEDKKSGLLAMLGQAVLDGEVVVDGDDGLKVVETHPAIIAARARLDERDRNGNGNGNGGDIDQHGDGRAGDDGAQMDEVDDPELQSDLEAIVGANRGRMRGDGEDQEVNDAGNKECDPNTMAEGEEMEGT